MKKFTFLLIAVLLGSLVLSACGASGPSTNLKVELTDFHFVPDKFVVPAGQEITLNLKNSGAVVHEYVIMKSGQTVGDDFGPEDEENIYWEVEVDPGASKTVTFTAPADSGEYQLVCGTEGHFKAGMVGTLTVK